MTLTAVIRNNQKSPPPFVRCVCCTPGYPAVIWPTPQSRSPSLQGHWDSSSVSGGDFSSCRSSTKGDILYQYCLWWPTFYCKQDIHHVVVLIITDRSNLSLIFDFFQFAFGRFGLLNGAVPLERAGSNTLPTRHSARQTSDDHANSTKTAPMILL